MNDQTQNNNMDNQVKPAENEVKMKSNPLKDVVSKLKPASLKLNVKTIIAIAVAILLGFGAYKYKNLFAAAIVNGKPVTRWSVIREIERRDGALVLEGLINKSLLEQEAKTKGVQVTDAEINSDITTIENNMLNQKTTLDDELNKQKISRDEFKKLLTTNKLLEKILADKVSVSDDEVNKYIEANKDLFPKDAKEEDKKTQVHNYLQQQKVDAESQKLFADLRAKAKIQYWIQY